LVLIYKKKSKTQQQKKHSQRQGKDIFSHLIRVKDIFSHLIRVKVLMALAFKK